MSPQSVTIEGTVAEEVYLTFKLLFIPNFVFYGVVVLEMGEKGGCILLGELRVFILLDVGRWLSSTFL